ncbi:MAG TPA: PKD domain-containing protein [Solirubrobacterales bacterium]
MMPSEHDRELPRWPLPAALLALALLVLLWAAAPAVAAPSWLATDTIASVGPRASGLTEDEVAIAPDGTSVAVWTEEFSIYDDVLYVAERPPGGPWGAPRELSPGGEMIREPVVAVDAAGEAVVVWSRGLGLEFAIESSSRPAGGQWGEPVELSAPEMTKFEQFGSSIAMDAAGDVVVVWQRGESVAGSLSVVVEAAERTAAGAWSAPEQLSAEGKFAQGPKVGIGADGEAVAAWESGNGTSYVVEGASRQVGGIWGSPVELSGVATTAPDVHLAMNQGGEAVVLWNANGSELQAATRSAAGLWGPSSRVFAAPGPFVHPRVAIDPRGDVTALWEAYDPTAGGTLVQAADRPAGGGWGTATNVSGSGADEPQLAMDAAGNAYAIWVSVGAVDRVETAVHPAGGTWGTPVELAEIGEEIREPRLAFDPAGDGVATWNSDAAVQAVGYDGAGPIFGELSIPATGAIGQQPPFSAAPSDVWSEVGPVTWSFGDGSTATGASVSHAYAEAGSYQVTVSATDAAGVASTRAQTLIVPPPTGASGPGPTGDAGTPTPAARPPRVRLGHTPNQRHGRHGKGKGHGGYAFRFSDPSGEATFYCSLDGSPFRRCASPKVYRHLRHGRHIFQVRAVAGGEMSPTRRVRFYVGRRRLRGSAGPDRVSIISPR